MKRFLKKFFLFMFGFLFVPSVMFVVWAVENYPEAKSVLAILMLLFVCVAAGLSLSSLGD